MAGTNASRRRILLADDDPGVRNSLGAVLEGEGYTVVHARDGQEALEFANGKSIDLVLLDLNMPVKNGWDAFERLTARRPLIPIVIITARPDQLFLAASAGAGALLEKPLDIPMLLQTIAKLLAESEETRLARLAGLRIGFVYAASPLPDYPERSELVKRRS